MGPGLPLRSSPTPIASPSYETYSSKLPQVGHNLLPKASDVAPHTGAWISGSLLRHGIIAVTWDWQVPYCL